MFQILILLSCAFLSRAEILYQHKFLLDNEQWFIIGNKNYEPAVHQSYNIDKSLSHYIMFKDNLINVDSVNKNDKTLWYFRSPDILMNEENKPGTTIFVKKQAKIPKLLTFNMNSFVGDFNKLNENVALVKIKNKNNCFVFKAPQYDGKSRDFNVPFISSLWEHEHNTKSNNKKTVTQEELNSMFVGTFSIEILGDWTQGMEVVGLDNVIIM